MRGIHFISHLHPDRLPECSGKQLCFVSVANDCVSIPKQRLLPLYSLQAQRHWMEITTSLPVHDWYEQTVDNDLQSLDPSLDVLLSRY